MENPASFFPSLASSQKLVLGMIVSVTIGWSGFVSHSISKPLLTIGLAACAFVLLNALRALIAYTTRRWRNRKAALSQIEMLAGQVDQVRSRHFKERSQQEGWNGIRKFYVSRKEKECDDCHSIYFTPCDGKSLPGFYPGQYLTFSLQIPGDDKPLVRCYSLSDSPGKPYYRCTIKKVPPRNEDLPPGRSSTYFNEVVQVGDIVDVKTPRGKFYLDTNKPGPVVLLAGGVGITPVLSMLNTVLDLSQDREVHFFLAVRHGQQHMFREHLEPFRQPGRNIRVYVVYSSPGPDDVQGRDYDFKGRVNIDLLNQVLPSNNFDYFMCGPIPFMDSLEKGLQEWGVPEERIHLEAFGGPPKKVKKPVAVGDGNGAPAPGPPVQFASSGKSIGWDAGYECLLDLAEANGISVESGCRAGNCGTCALAVKSGTVTYPEPPDMEPDIGMCLPCVCIPDGPLVLDA